MSANLQLSNRLPCMIMDLGGRIKIIRDLQPSVKSIVRESFMHVLARSTLDARYLHFHIENA
jgi:hypothetical protein